VVNKQQVQRRRVEFSYSSYSVRQVDECSCHDEERRREQERGDFLFLFFRIQGMGRGGKPNSTYFQFQCAHAKSPGRGRHRHQLQRQKRQRPASHPTLLYVLDTIHPTRRTSAEHTLNIYAAVARLACPVSKWWLWVVWSMQIVSLGLGLGLGLQ
jgi:hypothetical protein